VSAPVRVLFLDVDGTLTDGAIGWTAQGDARQFYVRDGIALEWAKSSGLVPVVISGRGSPAVAGRMEDLKVEYHLAVADKVARAQAVLDRLGVGWEATAMVGDDLPDVPLMRKVAWPIAVADAQPQVKALARNTTRAPGGRGAVREAVEMLLTHNGTWDAVLRRYEAK
jgi:3-deoxy-D-manno-octulosonate 8-phosphate phosphatase (KDO 8-P phosphatase)